MDLSGYRQAIIHLAWFRDDKVRRLIFGMVELRPNEFPEAAGCCWKSFRTEPKSRKYLHYQRFALPVADAVEWYRRAARGAITLPRDPERTPGRDRVDLKGSPFVEEPPWPHLVTSNELAFAPDWMHGSRTHFLFPTVTPPRSVVEIIQVRKNRDKLEEWINFDIVEAYPDYQGVLCMLAPNPVFRSIEPTRVEHAMTGSGETFAYKLVARQGQRLDGLRLEITNERLRGRMDPLVHEFRGDAIAVLESPAEVGKEGLTITHPTLGLLSWHEPLPLLRSIHTRMEIVQRRKRIRVPSGGRKRPGYEYEVAEVGLGSKDVVGNALENADIVSRLAGAEHRRSLRRAAKDYDQQWFHRMPGDAAHYVRQRIGRARETVLIVDPYFAGRELFAFGHAIRRPEVELRILTSTQGFGSDCEGRSKSDAAKQLMDNLDQTFKDYPVRPAIRVLTGDPPTVHDRFLIIDGSVWFSGNSLHTLGERAGVIVRLPDPTPIITKLNAFWQCSPPLSDWLGNRSAASGNV